jgi:hypothetical protein
MGFVKFSIALVFSVLFFYSCSNDPVTNNNNDPAETYQKVITAENGNLKFEVWSSTGDSLMSGYNKVGFKVYEDNQAKTTGFVRFFARMYHYGGGNMHATPVESAYYYNSTLEMFSGYIIMLMPSDTTSTWYGFYNYNDQLYLDSSIFDVGYQPLAKFKIFVDLETSLKYLITVLSPLQPVRNLNDFNCMLHESNDFIDFTQVSTAQMFIRPRLDSLNHESTGNENPVYSGEGIYSGKVNFDYAGLWRVKDSIIYNNKCITQTDPPFIVFIVP